MTIPDAWALFHVLLHSSSSRYVNVAPQDESRSNMGTIAASLELYPKLISGLSVGKRLPEAVYLHAAALPALPEPLRELVAEAEALAGMAHEWNVLKFGVGSSRISFLSYPGFLDDGFPSLKASTMVDLHAGKVASRSYQDENAPILHRKELLLPEGHPLIPVATQLTTAAERLGLFQDANVIGHRQPWEARLARLGLRVDGHTLLSESNENSSGSVLRYRTALTRYALSTPMQALWRHGFLDGTRTILDYGCGRGDDLRALQGRGIDALGWDPHFAPDGAKRASDVVNIGFVLNVIEDPEERAAALLGAWSLTQQLLVVSVLIGGRSTFERFRLYSDGVITARNTFQRYFTAAEFRDYLETHIGREPIVLAPGIAFVFRHDAEEQAFLAQRNRRRIVPTPPPDVPRIARATPAPRARAARQRQRNKWEANAELVDAFWERCIDLGRLAEPDEFDRCLALREAVGVPATVFRTLVRQRGSDRLDASRDARRDDLKVFLALNMFERRRSFSSLPESLRRDIKTIFGSYQIAQEEAQALLFSAGRIDAIRDACTKAASRGLGFLDGVHSLQFHSSLARELPPVLRVYLGCAARLYGDVETADVVKLHIQSGKVSLMSYDEFTENALPELIERVKINLRRQQIDFFEYGTAGTPAQPLYFKSRYIGPGFAHYEDQIRFDQRLRETGLDLSGFGPSRDVLTSELAKKSLVVDGFELVAAVDD